MDQSVQPSQNDQPINRAQPPVTISRPTMAADTPVVDTQPNIAMSSNVSGNKEAAPALINNESVPTPETVDLQPADNEPVIDASVEQVVEKSSPQEKPVLPEAVKQAGVTHSGPGVIPDKIKVVPKTLQVPENKFGITAMPISYDQALLEEKQTSFKSSKHWLMGVYEYVWRKINPMIGRSK